MNIRSVRSHRKCLHLISRMVVEQLDQFRIQKEIEVVQPVSRYNRALTKAGYLFGCPVEQLLIWCLHLAYLRGAPQQSIKHLLPYRTGKALGETPRSHVIVCERNSGIQRHNLMCPTARNE